MQSFIEYVVSLVDRHNLARIVFPEGGDYRIIKAANYLRKNKLCTPILLGSGPEINSVAIGCGEDVSGIEIYDPSFDVDFQKYASALYKLRKSKGIALSDAENLMKDPIYFGTMMVYFGKADGIVSGVTRIVSDCMRPGLQILKTSQGIDLVSSYVFMFMPDGHVYLFSDCSLNKNPSSDELVQIAKASIISAREFSLVPKVAMLSYSTKGSAQGESVSKVQVATEKLGLLNLGCPIEGEIQVDIAMNPDTINAKAQDSVIRGDATVFIFPNLDSGNIGYKLVQILAKAKVIGPILQGIARPVNFVSRTSGVSDIINVACVTAVQSKNAKNNPLPKIMDGNSDGSSIMANSLQSPEDTLAKLKLLAEATEKKKIFIKQEVKEEGPPTGEDLWYDAE